MNEQLTLEYAGVHKKPRTQLIKWVGNKQKFAETIASHFPEHFNRFFEPFLGSGAITGTLAPKDAIASDVFSPLMEIWTTLKESPEELISWYAARREGLTPENKKEIYAEVLSSFNKNPNGADFLFLTRSCYGGVVRFRKADNYMSTPCGAHTPISVESFRRRVEEWSIRMENVEFRCMDYSQAFEMAHEGDLIYCDPPYSHSQAILYGAQAFSLSDLIEQIAVAKKKGVFVALSIDGTKKSGDILCDIPTMEGVFERELFISLGGSMLKRFQLDGGTTHGEQVSDRLLLTY